MSVYNLYFTFGKPGTYFLDHGNGVCHQRMPDPYHSWTKQYKVQSMKSLACDAHDNLFLAWDCDTGRTYACSGGLKSEYPSLWTFIQQNEGKNCRVSLGPQVGYYFVINEKTGKTQWVSNRLSSVLRNDTRRVKACSLGISESYVIIFANGEVRWAVNTTYPDLWKILSDTKQGDVVFVALNPYRENEYFIVLANGTVHIRASALVEKHILDILSQYPDMTVVSSEVGKTGKSLTTSKGFFSRSRSKNFAKLIAGSVAGGVIQSAVAATFSCTVM